MKTIAIPHVIFVLSFAALVLTSCSNSVTPDAIDSIPAWEAAELTLADPAVTTVDGILLQASDSQYPAGLELIDYTIDNGTNVSIQGNPISGFTVEVQLEGAWYCVPTARGLRLDTWTLWHLKPQETLHLCSILEEQYGPLPPGRYRLRYEVEAGDELIPQTLISNPFTVESAKKNDPPSYAKLWDLDRLTPVAIDVGEDGETDLRLQANSSVVAKDVQIIQLTLQNQSALAYACDVETDISVQVRTEHEWSEMPRARLYCPWYSEQEGRVITIQGNSSEPLILYAAERYKQWPSGLYRFQIRMTPAGQDAPETLTDLIFVSPS